MPRPCGGDYLLWLKGTGRHSHVAFRALTAETYLAAARAHWSIENGLHGVLDVTFAEDPKLCP